MDAIKLEVDSEVLTAEVRYLEYVESMDGLDTLSVLLNVDESSEVTDFLPKLVPGAPFKVTLTPESGAEFLGEGDVISVDWRFTQDKTYEIRITGLETLHRLSYGAPPPTLHEGKHDAIVKAIASNHGLTGEADAVDTTEGFELQYNVSDALFIKQLCKKYNYYCRVIGTKLLYKARASAGSLTVDYHDLGRGIEMRASLHGLVTKVSAYGYDYLTQEGKEDPLTSGDITAMEKAPDGDLGYSMSKSAFKDIELMLNNTGLTQVTALKAAAQAEFDARAGNFVKGVLRVPGNGLAVSGVELTIEKLQWPFEGKFLIRQSRHVYDGTDYFTYIDFGSAALPTAS